MRSVNIPVNDLKFLLKLATHGTVVLAKEKKGAWHWDDDRDQYVWEAYAYRLENRIEKIKKAVR
jgi:hypothetical protein